jgi:hypothetical protein
MAGWPKQPSSGGTAYGLVIVNVGAPSEAPENQGAFIQLQASNANNHSRYGLNIHGSGSVQPIASDGSAIYLSGLSTQYGINFSGGTYTGAAIALGPGHNILLSTTTGTRIATNTAQLLGFWGATPVAQPAVSGVIAVNDALGKLVGALASTGLVANGTTAPSGDTSSFDTFILRRALGPATMPWLLASAGVSTSGGVLYGGLIYPETSSSHSQARFVTGSTTPAGITACRVVVWDINGNVIAQSQDCSSSVTAANTAITATFTSAVSFTVGTPVFAAVGYVGTTLPGLRGINLGASSLANRAMPNAENALGGRAATGWTGGSAPSGGGPANLIPYIEFV